MLSSGKIKDMFSDLNLNTQSFKYTKFIPLLYALSSNSAYHKEQQGLPHVKPFHGLAERSKLCKSHMSFDM